MDQRPTIKDIARETGVHHATVSRALRGLPNVAQETAERVRKAAEEMGYEPDPMMHALAAYRTSKRPAQYKETIAFLWPEQTREESAASMYHQRSLSGARARAAEMGFVIDEFWLREMPAKSLPRVLAARGIRGVIIAGYNKISTTRLPFPAGKLILVAMTASIKLPRLHRVGHDHFSGVQMALHELKKRGFRRIGFVLGEVQDRVLEHRYSAGFLSHHPLGLDEARKLLRMEKTPGLDEVARAIKETRADCILMTYTPDKQTHQKVPIYSLDLLPGTNAFSGISQQMDLVAANAVDLVAEQIFYGRHGIPENCKTILSIGAWVDASQTK